MKPTNLSRKNQLQADKKLLKKLAMTDKHFNRQEKNNRRLQIVKSFTAGHVRGGHSFH